MDKAALEHWLSAAAGAPVAIQSMARLSGGAIQQNWGVEATLDSAPQRWVLRTDNATTLAVSRSRVEEFALLRAAHEAGVTVAEPLFCCADAGVAGAPFFVMRRVAGTASGHALAKAAAARGGNTALAAAHGRELARIHRIRPPRAELAFLGHNDFIAEMRARLDDAGTPRPALEWGLRHMERNAPPALPPVLLHRDFRSGNVMVDGDAVTAVLDWEFAGWGDPYEDLGWFTARCWRFGQDHLEAGGIGPLDAFLAGYAAEAGWTPDPARVRYWQLGATIRWAVIAADQALRHISGQERSLELALTGHMVPGLEWEVLEMANAGTP
ncbi:phosphotransferase family protein [Rhodovarius crocodyli]|uniref:Phosphotransferase family protein n=1 Tax=Rhodovarius crocodyli TaxID=1979269 RepID=A0A437M3D4_9PROT|nr:phosphotransferase family protein [Rhodovarius crocodyli]RVT92221.1 phosphotransferase family protein [Rhodovarius crocodyli]